MLNLPLMKNPVNWLVVSSMALIGLLAVSLVSSPLRAPAQAALQPVA